MKNTIFALLIVVFLGCKDEKGSDSDFQKEMIALGQDYLDYKKVNPDFDSYKVYHDSILNKMRTLTKMKRLDTITVKVIAIDDYLSEAYKVTYKDGPFTYLSLIRFRDDIKKEESPFYEYKRTLKVGQVVKLPVYMMETSSLGIDNSAALAMFNMSDGGIEILIWPIPEGVDDIKSQMQKDLFNTWRNTPGSFD